MGDKAVLSGNVERFDLVTLKNDSIDAVTLLSQLSCDTFLQAYKNVHSDKDMQEYCAQYYSRDAIRKFLLPDSVQAVVAFDNQSCQAKDENAGDGAAGYYSLNHQPCPYLTDHQRYSQKVKSTELKQIYILSNFYGLGLGDKLFQHALDEAKKNQSYYLWLCVSDKNVRAQSFYLKRGFHRSCSGPTLKVGEDTLSSSVMLLSL